MTASLGRIAHRYLPIALSAAVILTLVVLVPDLHTSAQSAAGNLIPGGTLSGSSGEPTPGQSATPGAIGVVPGAQSSGPGGSTGGSANGSGATGTANGAGTTATGPTCSGGARQVAFSVYSPLCHTFSGSNGGATAHGVTASTITMTMRQTSDFDAASNAIGSSSFAASAHDSGVYIDYLNREYQLYGRKVVLKTFMGQGSFLAEVGGRDQQGAAADAQQAYDDGAFMEGTIVAPSTYQQALASHHVISDGTPDSLDALNAQYPYEFQYLLPAKDFVGAGAADVICQRMAAMKAIYAGDAALAAKQRTFALVEPLQQGNGGTDLVISRASQKCGVTVTKYQYDINPGQYAPEATQIAAQLKAANTTTVVLAADLIFSPIMTAAASSNAYHPEWLNISAMTNGETRQMSSDEVAHMIFMPPFHAQNFAPQQDECYKIYLAASGGAAPQSNLTTIDLICSYLLQAYGALETAGPNLNPASFGQGYFSQPPSTSGGQFGKWSFGAGGYCGCSTFTMQWWNPSPTNPYDGTAGAPTACRETGDLPYLNPGLGSGQLRCFS